MKYRLTRNPQNRRGDFDNETPYCWILAEHASKMRYYTGAKPAEWNENSRTAKRYFTANSALKAFRSVRAAYPQMHLAIAEVY